MSLVQDVALNGIGWEECFLSSKRCRKIVEELKFSLWRESKVVDKGEGDSLVSFTSNKRQSVSADQGWFGPELMAHLVKIENRVCGLFDTEPSYLELWQAIRYRNGGKFELHHDGGLFGGEAAGERALTFLLYLQGPKQGGETYFPELDLLIPPTAGKLVVWNNLRPDGTTDDRFRHAATPVHRGRKLVLTTWSRQRPIRT
ncbi:2OG-Fe(II) oxygenase [Arthrobacter sp. ok362]|uniref:prolyl hydroxylase family protein n=1 Tax=Arthrobacter sp. ok362 TaxID=1761745 RepID=UPI000882A1C8|nr:2OG-Fe(II) oxygenase [Arthrobacter sp. ok362]SDL40155.1 prolyl 4-hydroxylase [Arthrobacter sp. ok362]